ncbi:phosphoribosylformylglycinamidine synthase subunit PurQ, partial [Nonlabens dokdonensis]|uniref:phosphoribosylformylglycinamidine synthase subunit PurQ n=1 Tax=Nonlabens dokdonensis TaxID=328515 RepID=UPI0026EC6702
GKDSLSMKQKYPNEEVISPGTVIISAAGNCNDITKVVEPVFQKNTGDIYYINLSQDNYKLGGSSFAQVVNKIGNDCPTVTSPEFLKSTFNSIQNLIRSGKIVAGHDVASGGLITTLLELCFADVNIGADLNLSALNESDSFKILFAENAGIVIQSTDNSIEQVLSEAKIEFFNIGKVTESDSLNIVNNNDTYTLSVSRLRDMWYKTSFLLDQKQTANNLAEDRFNNYKNQPLQYTFPNQFTGKLPLIDATKPRPKAAILREKGSNSEREMANAMYLAGFDVKDVHMTDLISGRETLEDIQFIGAVGGFSNSDV